MTVPTGEGCEIGNEGRSRAQVTDAVIHILPTNGWRDLTIREVGDAASRLSTDGIPEWRFWLSLFGWMPFDGMLQAEVQKVHRLHAELIVPTDLRPMLAKGASTTAANRWISPSNSSVPLSGFACRWWPIPRRCHASAAVVRRSRSQVWNVASQWAITLSKSNAGAVN
jgi:hypothetical protein